LGWQPVVVADLKWRTPTRLCDTGGEGENVEAHPAIIEAAPCAST